MTTKSPSDFKVGITASSFDVLHAGHISMLTEAKLYCDHLVCALHIDPSKENKKKNKPIQTVVERFVQLQAVRWVKEIIPYETEADLCNLFNLRHFDVRIIGEEYYGKPFTGKDINKKNGTEIIYNKRRHDFSSTLKRMQIRKNEIEKAKL